jgi:dolichyl-phosphate-mannose--protein O-mannosyl transferase
MSQWWDWPLMIRPIWYAFDKEGANQEFVRGVICIGNPAVVYTGLLALVFCLWGWIETRSKDAFIILATYVVFYGSWVLIPRKIAFYYYYYPAAMVLGLALAYFFHYLEKDSKKRIFSWAFIGVCVWFFVYFFPILAARQIPVDSFSKWMWSRSWI